MKFDFDEFTHQLSGFNPIFYTAWRMGVPMFSDMVPTAAVLFNRKGDEIAWTFNPKFWEPLNDRERAFIFCHEVLHIVLQHGKRTVNKDEVKDGVTKAIDDYRTNVALDIVVNEMLLSIFGFDKEELPNLYKFNICTLETIFLNKTITINGQEMPNDLYNPNIKPNQSFEYYYNNLAYLGDKQNWTIIDDHSQLSGEGNLVAHDELSEKIENTLDDETKQKLANKMAGTEFGNHMQQMYVQSTKKKKWETVIKQWVQKAMVDTQHERWAPRNRRIQHLPNDIFLPSIVEREWEERHKINLWFFQDTSGSCHHLAERFFKAAKSIPTERFNIKLFAFDTRVYPVVNNQLGGGGGTSFTCIEQYIQTEVRQGKSYPDAVFLITDGWGDLVSPEFAEKWHWFLSENVTNCIPSTSHIYKLEDFE